jgi:hypothetical protein
MLWYVINRLNIKHCDDNIVLSNNWISVQLSIMGALTWYTRHLTPNQGTTHGKFWTEVIPVISDYYLLITLTTVRLKFHKTAENQKSWFSNLPSVQFSSQKTKTDPAFRFPRTLSLHKDLICHDAYTGVKWKAIHKCHQLHSFNYVQSSQDYHIIFCTNPAFSLCVHNPWNVHCVHIIDTILELHIIFVFSGTQ